LAALFGSIQRGTLNIVAHVLYNPLKPKTCVVQEQSKTFDTIELEAISDNVLRPIATNDITIFLPTHQDARIHVSVYTSNANSIQKIGHVLVTGRMLNGTKGELVLPVADMYGGSLGELSISFLIVTPFAHKNNNLNTLWMSYRTS
jgi:hypothetical protein